MKQMNAKRMEHSDAVMVKDKATMWHPFTQAQGAQTPLHIVRGEGEFLFDKENRSYTDLISSWWVNLYGHAHPHIAQAIAKQSSVLEHVMFGGFTHEPACSLMKRLQGYVDPLTHFFFSDNGSTAMEVALKMSYQYWHNKGQTKKYFVSFEGGYHGDTVGAMGLSPNQFTSPFEKILLPSKQIPFPEYYDGATSVIEEEAQALAAFESLCQSGDIVALVVEPIVQGASGMRVCRVAFMNNLMNMAKHYGVFVVFDEVMTGFGRTGKMFAFNHLESVPDFLCLAKGLTGGFLPLAVTVTTEEVYSAFLGQDLSKAFLHGHSYTANPLGCVAALAALDLWEQNATRVGMWSIEQIHTQRLVQLRKIQGVSKVRQKGTIAAWSYDGDTDALKAFLLNSGVILRPIGRECYLIPPYCIKPEVLHQAYDAIEKALESCL